MISVISHAFSLALYYPAGILSVDDLCIFEYLVLASTGTGFYSSGVEKK